MSATCHPQLKFCSSVKRCRATAHNGNIVEQVLIDRNQISIGMVETGYLQPGKLGLLFIKYTRKVPMQSKTEGNSPVRQVLNSFGIVAYSAAGSIN